MRIFTDCRAGVCAGAATVAIGLATATPAAAQDLGGLIGDVTSPACTVTGTILGPDGECIADPSAGVPSVGTLPGGDDLTAGGSVTGNTATSGGGDGGEAGAAADGRAPLTRVAARSGRLSLALRRGYSIVVFCDEACTITGTATRARSRATLARGQGRVAARGKAKVRLRFTRNARRALRRGWVAKLTIRVTVRDGAGNAAAKRLAVKLRR